MQTYASSAPRASAAGQQQLAPELVAAVQELIKLHKLRRTSRGSDDVSVGYGDASKAQPVQTPSPCQEPVEPVSPQQQQTLEHLLQRWSAQRAAAKAAQAVHDSGPSYGAEGAEGAAASHHPASDHDHQQWPDEGQGEELLAESRELYPVEEVEEEGLEEGPGSSAAGAHGQSGAWGATQVPHDQHSQHQQPLVQPLWEDAMAVYYEEEEEQQQQQHETHQQQQQQHDSRPLRLGHGDPSHAATHEQQAQALHRASAALARASGEFLEPEESHAAVVAPPTAAATAAESVGVSSVGGTLSPSPSAPTHNTSSSGRSTGAAGALDQLQAAQQQQDRSQPVRQLVALLQQHLQQVQPQQQQQQQPPPGYAAQHGARQLLQQQEQQPALHPAGAGDQEDWQQPVSYAAMYRQQRRQSSSAVGTAAGADVCGDGQQPPASGVAQAQEPYLWPEQLQEEEEEDWHLPPRQQQQQQRGQRAQLSSSRWQHEGEDSASGPPAGSTWVSSSRGATSAIAGAAAAEGGSPSPPAARRMASAHMSKPLQLKGRLLPSLYHGEQGHVPSYATQTFSAAAKAAPVASGAVHMPPPVWHPTSCSSRVGSATSGAGQQASVIGARLRSATSSASSSRRQSRHAEELPAGPQDVGPGNSRGQLPTSHGCSTGRSGSKAAAGGHGKGCGTTAAMQRRRSTSHTVDRSSSSSRRQSAAATVTPAPRRRTVGDAPCTSSSSRRSSGVDLDPLDAHRHQQNRGMLQRSRSLTPPRAWGAGGRRSSPGSPPRGGPAADDAHCSNRGADSSGGGCSKKEERRWLSPGTGGRLFDQYSDRRRSSSRDGGGRRDSSPGTAAGVDGVVHEHGMDAPGRGKTPKGHHQHQEEERDMQGEVQHYTAAELGPRRGREAADHNRQDQQQQQQQQQAMMAGAGGGQQVATSSFSVFAQQHSSNAAMAPDAVDAAGVLVPGLDVPPGDLTADVLRGYTNGFVDGHLQALAAAGQEAAALQVRKKLVKEAALHVLQTTLAAKGIRGEQAEAMQRTLSAALAAQAWPLQQQPQQQQEDEAGMPRLQPQLQQPQQPVVQPPPGGWSGEAMGVHPAVAAASPAAAAPAPGAALASPGPVQQQVVLGQQDPEQLQQAITAFLQQQGQGPVQVLYSRPSTAQSSISGLASCYQQDPTAAAAGTSGANLQGSCYAVTAFDRETEAYLIPVMHIGVQTSTGSLDYTSPRSAAAAAAAAVAASPPPAAHTAMEEPVGWPPPPLQVAPLCSNSSGAVGLDDAAAAQDLVRMGSPQQEGSASRVLEWEEAPVARPCGPPPPQPMTPSCQAGPAAPPAIAAAAAEPGVLQPLDDTECWSPQLLTAPPPPPPPPQQQQQQEELSDDKVVPEPDLAAAGPLVEEGSGSSAGVEAEISLRSLGQQLAAESSGASSAHGSTGTAHPAASVAAKGAAGVDGLGDIVGTLKVAAVPVAAAADLTTECSTGSDQVSQDITCMSHHQQQHVEKVELHQQHAEQQGGASSWQVQPQMVLQGGGGTSQGPLSAAAPTICEPGVGPVATPEAAVAGASMAALPPDPASSTATTVFNSEGTGQGGVVAPAPLAAPVGGHVIVDGDAPGSPGGAYTMQMLLPLLRELRGLRSAMSDGAAVEPAHLLRLQALLQQVVALQQHLTAKHGPGHPVTAQLAALQQDLAAWQQVAWAATSRPASRASNSSLANSSRAGSLVLAGPPAAGAGAAKGGLLGQDITPVAPAALDAGFGSAACVAGGMAAAPQQQQQQQQQQQPGSRGWPGGAAVNPHRYSQQLTRGSSWSSALDTERSRSRDMGSPPPGLGCFPSFTWRHAPCQPPEPQLPASPVPRHPHRQQQQQQRQQQQWPEPEQSLWRQRRLSLDAPGSGSDSSREPSPGRRPGHGSSSSRHPPGPDLQGVSKGQQGAAGGTTPTTSPRLLAQALKHSLKEQLRKLRGKRSKGTAEAEPVIGHGGGGGPAGVARGQMGGKGGRGGARWPKEGQLALPEDAAGVAAYQDQW